MTFYYAIFIGLVTTNHQPVFGPPHGAKQALLCFSNFCVTAVGIAHSSWYRKFISASECKRPGPARKLILSEIERMTTKEGKAAVFVAVDHFNSECVCIHASKSQTHFEALEPIRQGVGEHVGGFAEDITRGLKIRYDHGSQYMSDEFQ